MIGEGNARRRVARVIGPLARRVTASRARILMYHRFSDSARFGRTGAKLFEQELAYLRAHFNPRRLGDVISQLRRGEPLDERTVVVTVDDGYTDFLHHAYPLLQKYGIPATIYLVSSFTSHQHWLWFDAIHWLTQAAQPGRYPILIGGRSIDARIASETERNDLWRVILERCLALPPTEPIALVSNLQQQFNVALPERPVADYAPLNWDQIRSLDPQLIEVGSHTRTHPVLSRCTSDEQREEIEGSKREIEAQIGRPIEAFCYPNGQSGDFTEETVTILRNCGFTSAATAYGGMVMHDASPYRLHRIGAPADMHMFRNCVNGLWEIRASMARTAPRGDALSYDG